MHELPVVGVQIDLKGYMPRKAYLYEWVRELPELGINTLLLEYEDTFPFQKYPFLRSPHAFTPDELHAFLATIRATGLRLVPLVQTLGHLEFALNHPQLAHLREAPHILNQIDTSNPEAVQLVHDLLDEILPFHEPDQWIHLGADEAWHLGANPRSAQQLEQAGGKIGLWARHERQMIEHVARHGKRALLWDDIFWSNPDQAREIDLPHNPILVTWEYGVSYGDNHREKLKRVESYQAAGFDVIGAPCLNGGVLLPESQRCMKNTAALADKVRRSNMLGIINTAWCCFALPPTQHMDIAATRAAMEDPSRPLQRDWQEAFLEKHFGTHVRGVVEAMAKAAISWEWPTRTDPIDTERKFPITGILYSQSDIYFWIGSHQKCREQGLYPLDWADVDFNWILREKLRLLRAGDASSGGVPSRELDAVRQRYEEAVPVLADLAERATRHQGEARYFALMAELKALHARIMVDLLGEGQTGAAQRQAWAAMRPRLQEVLQPFLEDLAVSRILRSQWEPTAMELGLVTDVQREAAAQLL